MPQQSPAPVCIGCSRENAPTAGLAVASLLADIDEPNDLPDILSQLDTSPIQWGPFELDDLLLRIDTPSAQGLAGFTGPDCLIELTNVVFELAGPFTSALMVSLDEHPLACSGRILLRVVGKPAPAGQVMLRRRDAHRLHVTPLDEAGRPMADRGYRDARRIRLAQDITHYVITLG